MEAKGNIRKEVFARRRAATQEEIQEKSRMIYEKITALPEFLDADCFFAYMDFKKEVMTRDLIEKALQMGKTVAVPRVEGDDMVYYEIKDFSTLKSGFIRLSDSSVALMGFSIYSLISRWTASFAYSNSSKPVQSIM